MVDVDNDEQMYVLHMVYLPRLNIDLKDWREVWNHHPIRTERNRSPHQIWSADFIINSQSTYSSIRNNLDTTKADREQQINEYREENGLPEPSDIRIVISRLPEPLSEPLMNELRETVDVMRPSDSNAVEIYWEVLNFIISNRMP